MHYHINDITCIIISVISHAFKYQHIICITILVISHAFKYQWYHMHCDISDIKCITIWLLYKYSYIQFWQSSGLFYMSDICDIEIFIFPQFVACNLFNLSITTSCNFACNVIFWTLLTSLPFTEKCNQFKSFIMYSTEKLIYCT